MTLGKAYREYIARFFIGNQIEVALTVFLFLMSKNHEIFPAEDAAILSVIVNP